MMFAGVTWCSCICSKSWFATLTSAALYVKKTKQASSDAGHAFLRHICYLFLIKPITCFVNSLLSEKVTEAVASTDLMAFLSHHTCGVCHREGSSQQAIHVQHDKQDAYGATSESWMFDGSLQCQ